jgi:hypothetical protein
VLNFDVPSDVPSITKGVLSFFANVSYAQSPDPRKQMKLNISFVVDSPFYFRTGVIYWQYSFIECCIISLLFILKNFIS